MKAFNILYKDENDLAERVNAELFSSEFSYAVRIYTAMATPEEAVAIACQMRSLIPSASIIGASASGVVFQGKQYEDQTLIVIERLQNARSVAFPLSFEGKTASGLALELAQLLQSVGGRFAHILFDGHYYDVHDFVEAFNRFSAVRLAGGIAGDLLPRGGMPYVFTEKGIVSNGLVASVLCGEEFSYYIGTNIAHDPISELHTLSKADGSHWHEIDGVPANEWFRQQLGIEVLQQYDDWQIIADNDVMIRFPVILEGHGGASRFLQYDAACDLVSQYYSRIPQGTKFRIGYVSPAECVKESLEICNELFEHPIQALFFYSCLFRRLYLNNCAEWEISAYRSFDLCGAFLMGEIGWNKGRNEFLNGSFVLVGVSEEDVYIRPDMRAFEQLSRVEDDTKSLLDMAMRQQNKKKGKENERLLHTLLSQQKQSKRLLYVDYATGLANYLRFKEDRKSTNFDKICMVKVENAELVTTHLGQEAYIDFLKAALEPIRDYMRQLDNVDFLHCYIFNETTFFVVCDKRVGTAEFLDTSRKLFNQFRFINLLEKSEVLVNRFVVVTEEEELVELALNAFWASKNRQAPFIICENKGHDTGSTAEEFNIIGVLNRAISNDGVVPYFQGIYDNKQRAITKYEALMRIRDVDGQVYLPHQFMEVAKKYQIYVNLSQIMITKVLALFAGQKESVSINLSAYDISSLELQQIIFEQLEALGDASNLVLELLEEEEFRDIHMLGDFIKRVRNYGVQIAIDDFGAGYSNMLEIASISPDYIKVDGSIIKSLHVNPVNAKIVDIITYMGKHFDAEIIAEFVENGEIQAQIEKHNITYSQGYHFSRPAPYEALGRSDT